MTLGDRIYELRTTKGLSQEQFALEIEVSKETVAHWENDVVMPSIHKLILLSELFDVSLDYLIKGQDKINQSINCQYRQNRIYAVIGIILMSFGMMTYVLICAMRNMNDSLEYTLYRYINFGEYTSSTINLSFAYGVIVSLIVLGILSIVYCYRRKIRSIAHRIKKMLRKVA